MSSFVKGVGGGLDPATRPLLPMSAIVRCLVGAAGLAFSLTILWLSMRAVMGIGGSCASGGPYVPAVECPDAVVLLTPASIFTGIASAGLLVWGGAQLPGAWAGLVGLAWPALFLSLGWNFLEFGLRPPGGQPGEIVWSWLFCAIVFFLMGGGPLVLAIWGAREAIGSHRSYAGGRVLVGPRSGFEALRELRTSLDTATASDDDRADVTARMERLARLHRAGDLTDAEFQAAKRATLDAG